MSSLLANYTVLEDALVLEKNNQQSYPAVTENDCLERYAHGNNNGSNITGIANHFLIGFKYHSTR